MTYIDFLHRYMYSNNEPYLYLDQLDSWYSLFCFDVPEYLSPQSFLSLIKFLTGPRFPIGIEHLIYMIFFVTVRQMGIKGI